MLTFAETDIFRKTLTFRRCGVSGDKLPARPSSEVSDLAETLRDGGKWRPAVVGDGVASSPIGGGRSRAGAEGRRRRVDGRIMMGLGRELDIRLSILWTI